MTNQPRTEEARTPRWHVSAQPIPWNHLGTSPVNPKRHRWTQGTGDRLHPRAPQVWACMWVAGDLAEHRRCFHGPRGSVFPSARVVVMLPVQRPRVQRLQCLTSGFGSHWFLFLESRAKRPCRGARVGERREGLGQHREAPLCATSRDGLLLTSQLVPRSCGLYDASGPWFQKNRLSVASGYDGAIGR